MRSFLISWLMLLMASDGLAAPQRPRARSAAAGKPTPNSLQVKESQRLFALAEAHYQAGEVERALELYQKAYQLTPLPGFLFNMAQCHRRLGQWSRALAFYRAYAEALPNSPNQEQVQALITMCREKVAKQRPSMTARRSAPAPVEPRPSLLAAPDPEPMVRSAPPELVPARDQAPQPRRKRPWIFAGAGLTGALLLTGTVTGALALGASDEYQREGLTAGRRDELKSRGEAMRLASTVTFSMAGASAAGTIILYLLDRREQNERRAQVTVSPMPGGGAVVVARRF